MKHNETKCPTLEGCKPTYFSLFTTCLKDTWKSSFNVQFEKTYSKVRAYSTAGMGPWSVSSDAMQVQPPQWDLFTAEGMKDGYI